MKNIGLTAVFTMIATLAWSADDATNPARIAATAALANVPVDGSVSRDDGLDAWGEIFNVFSHPRCSNCHVDDGVPMWSGDHYGKTRPHGMYVGGDPELTMGQVGQQCSTCHADDNSPVLHGPPGSEIWALAPAEFVWFEKSSEDICAQVRDPNRNGDRTILEIAEHIEHDALVHWGWAPGPGREPAPGSAAETITQVLAWGAAGAPCPQD